MTATYIKTDLHFQGVFSNKSFCYFDSTHHVFENVNYACMDLKECVAFLERFTQKKCVKLYYCMSDIEFIEGLRLISNELKYVEFINITYRCDVQLSMYMGHFVTNLHVLSDEFACYEEYHSGVSDMSG